MTVVIGSAGHIDHGKTTLLRALTGIDADRLPEERARGMTIDVGYAHLALEEGTDLDFVDVPGHDRLVGNMLVGAGEIDAALLVVAADDGPRAQTREHLELLDALGIADGLVVVTKSDAVEPARVDAVVAEARALIGPTSLGGSPVLAASALTGDGLAAVTRALAELRDRVAERATAETGAAELATAEVRGTGARGGGTAAATSRLAIDRVFTIHGRGTVVTGTLRGAPLERGAILRAVPGAPDRRVRVREVQVHGRAVDRAGPGRVALNVAGDGVEGLERGTVLTNDPAVVATDRWLVALRPAVLVGPIGGTPRAANPTRELPADRTPVAIHAGTAHASAVLGRSGRDAVDLGPADRRDPGAAREGSAILRLDRPIAVAPGDRFVIRRSSPIETLGGGRVLDPEPARGVARRRATPDRLRALAAAAPRSAEWQAVRLDLHGALAGAAPAAAPDIAAAIDAALVAAADAQPGIRIGELSRTGETVARRAVGPLGGRRPTGSAASTAGDPLRRLVAARLEDLIEHDRLVREADRIRLPGAPAVEPDPALGAAMDRLVGLLATAAPPPLPEAARLAGCPPEGIRRLEAAGRIVRLEDALAWATTTWRELAVRALDLARQAPLTPAAYRDATGTSRKYVMALLEDLDRRAILLRTDAGHLPGPRAGLVAAAEAPPTTAEAPPTTAEAPPAGDAVEAVR